LPQNKTSNSMEYLERAADRMLKDRLDGFGAVLIEGPKWCGKTTTASKQAQSIIKLQDPDNAAEYLATAATKPSLLLKGANPRLIDEWQDAPVLWDTIRNDVDSRGDVGLYILTGSNTVKKEEIKHSGTGRIAKMKMYPMSLWESKESSGQVSLQRLFDEPDYDIDGAQSPLSIEDLIFVACRGGWPASLKARTDVAKLLIAQEYLNTLCSDDINRIDNRQRDERLARMILRSYARNISTLAKKNAILSDITSSGEFNVSIDTMDDYLNVFNRLFVIQDIEAWCPPIRSKTAIRSSFKREFVDPSIAVAALGLAPEALQIQLKTFGFIFENMCARDLRAYSQQQRGTLSYYRDRYNLESDLVLHLGDGRYALIECKLGSAEIEDGSKHLKQIANLIKEYNKTEKQNPIPEPNLLIVLTGGKMAYTRADGVKVIPLGCLKW
jgi:hypothetical protein